MRVRSHLFVYRAHVGEVNSLAVTLEHEKVLLEAGDVNVLCRLPSPCPVRSFKETIEQTPG